MIVASFDPGETTGWCKARVRYNEDITIEITGVGAWHGLEEMDECIHEPLTGARFAVMEDYRVYPTHLAMHAGQQVYTAEEIGRITAYALRFGLTEPDNLIRQTASMAKQRFPDQRLSKYAGHFDGPHITDAVRHLLTFVERSYGTPEVL